MRAVHTIIFPASMAQAKDQPISKILQEFATSGKPEHFYNIARCACPETSSVPFTGALDECMQLTKPGHSQHNSVPKLSDSEYAEQSTTLFHSDVEQIRSDSEFAGSSQQLDYVRDILNCRY